MEDLAKILDEDTLSFRALNEVRWLSRHQAVNAVLRNYTVLSAKKNSLITEIQWQSTAHY